jgi:hypothetical protein
MFRINMLSSLKHHLRATLRNNPDLAQKLSNAAHLCGAKELGAKITRAGNPIDETVEIQLPLGHGQNAFFNMESIGGRDLVVQKIRLNGWHGFERPLPDLMVQCAKHLKGTFIDVGANSGFYSLCCIIQPFPTAESSESDH